MSLDELVAKYTARWGQATTLAELESILADLEKESIKQESASGLILAGAQESDLQKAVKAGLKQKIIKKAMSISGVESTTPVEQAQVSAWYAMKSLCSAVEHAVCYDQYGIKGSVVGFFDTAAEAARAWKTAARSIKD
jgi:hypothetical protein